MLKRIIILVFVLSASLARAQYFPIGGYCNKGAAPAATSGLQSTNFLQGIIPQCQITVYLTGTTTKAAIYSNATGTVLTNPFTATGLGSWLFYSASGQQYDIVGSGGIPPNVYPYPITIETAVSVSAGGGAAAPPKYAQQYSNATSSGFVSDYSILNTLFYTTGNNGITMSLAECQTYTYACQVLAPALYATTEPQPWGGSLQYINSYFPIGPSSTMGTGCVEDQRQGGPEWLCTPAFAPTWTGDTIQRFQMGPSFTMFSHIGPVGLSGYGASALQATKIDQHGSRSTTAGIGDQTSDSAFSAYYFGNAPASVSSVQNHQYCNSSGDCIGYFGWQEVRGGLLAGDNEQTEGARLAIMEANDVYQGTINAITSISSGTVPCTAPCTVLATTQTQGFQGSLGEQLPVIDVTRAYSTGYIAIINGTTSITASSSANWDSNFGLSSGIGTLNGNISNATGGSTTQNTFPQTNVTVPIITTTGAPSTSKSFCIFDTDGVSWECDPITAASPTSVTLAVVTLPHSTGAIWAQGGMTGMGFRLPIDCIGPGNNPGLGTGSQGLANTICPTYPIEYNTSGGVAKVITGNRGGFSSGNTRAPFEMGSGGSVTATVAGGIVTGCTASGGTGYSIFFDPQGFMIGPPQLTYTVNAGGTPPVLALGPGGGGGAALSACYVIKPGAGLTSVSVTVSSSPDNYSVFPMARAQNVWNPTTGKVDGSSIAVDAGSGISAFQVGDTIELEHHYAMAMVGLTSLQSTLQPAGQDDGAVIALGGTFGGNQYGWWLQNVNQPVMYGAYPPSGTGGATPWVPGNGMMTTPYGYTLSGAWKDGLNMKSPPFSNSGGLTGVIAVGCYDYVTGVNVCATWTHPYNYLSAANANSSGFAEDELTYDPKNLAWAWTAGATGAGGFNPTCTFTHGVTGMTYNCPFNLYGVVSGLLSNWVPESNNFSGGPWVNTAGTTTTGVADQWGGTSATTFAGTTYALINTYTPSPLTANTNYTVCVYGHMVSGTNQFGMFAGAGTNAFLMPNTGWGPVCSTINSGSSNLTRIFALNVPVTTSFTLEGVTVSLASSPSAGYLYTGATPSPTPTQGLSPAFCINGNNCALSALSISGSTPVTAINGGGTALPSTSDTTTTTGHVVTEQNATGEYGDSGVSINSLCQTSGTNCPSSLNPPVTITTTAAVTISGTSGYYFNQEATAATAVTYTLPAPVAGYQFCVKNSNNGSAATTGVLELLVANTGTQSIIYNGTKSTSGFFSSSGAAGDFGCVIGISATQWEATASVGSWAIH